VTNLLSIKAPGHALREVVDNAIKFSSPESTIEIDVYSEDNESTVFSVRDYGRGIPVEAQSKLFDTFFQVEREVNEQEGTGSGLTVVKGIMKLHNDVVTIESKVGEGTRVELKIPAAQS